MTSTEPSPVTTRKILITGDAGPDYDLYIPSDADNPSPGVPPTRIECSLGGAGLAHRILGAWAGERSVELIGFAPPSAGSPPTFAVWRPQGWGKLKPDRPKERVWRVERSISPDRILTEMTLPSPALPAGVDAPFRAGVVVIVDNSNRFRHSKGAALPHETMWAGSDAFAIWKMAPPFCRGQLWWRAVEAGVTERAAVIVTLKHLRTAPIRVSRRISWERTALEVARELECNPALADLRSFAHVIVTIHGEGALWRRKSGDRGDFTLFFDPAHMEGEWWPGTAAKGEAYGYASAFAAALAAECAMRSGSPEGALGAAIPRGLLAMRVLQANGHGTADDKATPAFPAALLADVIRDGEKALRGFKGGVFGGFAAQTVPSEAIADSGPRWRLALAGDRRPAEEPLYGLARRVAIFGERELRRVPHARFGKILTADRDEIEALRNLKTLIENYRDPNEARPLSLAVFGPPGAGKSFGVKQIVQEVLGKDGAVLEFNLSQFADADLAGAFHQVRDKRLEGKMPVVFWDEFDSSEYKWLRLLLAPMNDGVFQEGQITHPLGRCIFVFAGGTSYDMEHFGPVEPGEGFRREAVDAWNRFKLVKGPDFKSRIHGSLDVLGPNRRMVPVTGGAETLRWGEDDGDVCFPLRRAILLRSILGLKPDQRLDIDAGLLGALIETGKYSNGSRSFEKILRSMGDKKDKGARYRPSDLPSDDVLAMNVADLKEFKALIVRDDGFKAKAPLLAKAFHDVWRRGKREQKGREAFNYDCEFEALPANKKNDNLNAAMRMPRNLILAGFFIVPARDAGSAVVSEIPEELVEVMAQEEHFQWVEDALADGFRQKREGEERNDAELIHDCILPWDVLPEGQRDYDRWFVRSYPRFAGKAGFAIVAKRPK
ncbi:MAG TPA: AAA family ATPase [Verrucomicrobiae bacterium]|nr:AAA family ATPase [Verrucomicrobiae bacterium]